MAMATNRHAVATSIFDALVFSKSCVRRGVDGFLFISSTGYIVSGSVKTKLVFANLSGHSIFVVIG